MQGKAPKTFLRQYQSKRTEGVYRTKRGLPELDLSNWLRSPETLEYVRVVEEDLNVKCVDPTPLEIRNSSLVKN